MSPRTTGLLLLAALALGAFVYLYEIRDPTDEAAEPSPGDLVFDGFDATDIAWVELPTSDGPVARAERVDGGWRLVAPGHWRADSVALDGVASQLVGLDVQGRVSSSDVSPEDFGVGEGVPPIRFEAAGRTYALRIGARTPVGSNTYVRADASDGAGDEAASEAGNEVAWVSSWRTNALRKRLTDLRDRRVLDFDHAAIERVEVRWSDGSIVAEKDGADWRLRRPVDERADRSAIETLLSDLAFLRADGFVDEPLAPAESGLDEPVLTVILAPGSGEGDASPLELRFGALLGEQRIARGVGQSLFLIDEERLEDVPREVLAYRFKALGDFDVADARGLGLTFGSEGVGERAPRRMEATLAAGRWQTVPDAVADERVREMITALSRLEAIAIVAEQVGDFELAALGLDPARVSARVTGEAGEVLAEVSFGLQGGRHETGRGILAKRSDSPIIYRVDDTVAARLPLDAADFAARFIGEDDPPDDAEEPWSPDLDDADEIPDAFRDETRVDGSGGADLGADLGAAVGGGVGRGVGAGVHDDGGRLRLRRAAARRSADRSGYASRRSYVRLRRSA